MFLTRRFLSRRTVLRGIGATLALPLLDAMVPALASRSVMAATPPRRFGAVFVPMGERPSHWTPKTSGKGFELSPILEPLAPFKDSMIVVSNADRPLQGTHAVSSGTWLTGCAPKRTEAEDFVAGTSLDQIIAAQIGRDTVFPSLEIGTEDLTGYVGACDVGYSCAYMNTISWRTPTTPMPLECNPRVVFERMFGRPGSTEERVARMRQNRSILDSVRGDVSSLEKGLGARDRLRLDQYLDHVREIEARIQRAEQQATTEVLVPKAPIGIPDSWAEHASTMFDLMAVAWEADLTRVFSFMLNREASQLVFPELDFNEPWHHVSHHGNEPEKLALLVKLNIYQIGIFGKFLDRLRTTPDGDGSLLDHSVVLWGSGMSDSNAHSPLDLPYLQVGSGSGLFKGDRHLVATKGTELADVMLTVAQRFGAEIDHFGVSTNAFEL
ncbi:MAG TPA: DUF1552 domain-containing protein [Vicinamibacterales bacterium]|jgi:hypothetical protein|nr:DUF1552 domain-containing protein [Vicinamibacterales bacterium]